MESTLLESPRPAPRAVEGREWWRGAVIYQIYPRSFADANGDGIGDLKGITRHLDYVAGLKVDAIWLSPFYVSPMKDFGYDVADHCDVDPMFGTLADFEALVERAHALGLKVMIDLVISHSSDRHPWFVESRSSRTNAKADWYVWADAQPDGTPPNNWLSVFGGPAWEWDTRRNQYYLHNFLAAQPDLNFHNEQVRQAVLDIARFWLERGVDGFRLDAVNFYFHDRQLRNNPPVPEAARVRGVAASNPYAWQAHIHDKTQPENLAFLERLRRLCDSYAGIATVGEIGADHDPPVTTAAYTEAGKRLNMAYSFDLLTEAFSAAHIRAVVESVERTIGSGWASWAFSNHDVVRVISRWNLGEAATQAAPMLVALLTSLRGTACLYQGEELGLCEADVPFERLQDPYGIRFWPDYKGRDGCRTPMPWRHDAPHAGFSRAAPWLPVPEEHARHAVSRQIGDPASVLSRVRRFLAWRARHPVLRYGSIRFLEAPEPVIAFTRGEGRDRLVCAFNLGPAAVELALPGIPAARALEGHGFGGTLADGRVRLEGFEAAFGHVQVQNESPANGP